MALTLLSDGLGQKVDTLMNKLGASRFKLGVGTRISGSDNISWQGVATHEQGETFDAADGLAVLGGISDVVGTGVAVPVRVDTDGRMSVVSAPSTGTVADASDLSLNTNATSQVLFSGNPSRKYLLIQNNSGATIWIEFGTAAVQASPSIRLEDGDSMEYSGAGFMPTQSVNWIAALAGTIISAKAG